MFSALRLRKTRETRKVHLVVARMACLWSQQLILPTFFTRERRNAVQGSVQTHTFLLTRSIQQAGIISNLCNMYLSSFLETVTQLAVTQKQPSHKSRHMATETGECKQNNAPRNMWGPGATNPFPPNAMLSMTCTSFWRCTKNGAFCCQVARSWLLNIAFGGKGCLM